jgi:hypothetical protein
MNLQHFSLSFVYLMRKRGGCSATKKVTLVWVSIKKIYRYIGSLTICFPVCALGASNLDSLKLSERELPSKTIVFVTKQSSNTQPSKRLFKAVCGLMGESCRREKRFFVKRSDVLKAIPEIQLDSRLTQIKKPNSAGRVIPSIQQRLDSNAAENAVIMDCKQMEDGRAVSNCGLYLYSSQQKSVVASSVRYFSVPISEPVKWAEPIYSSFLDGLQAKERLKEQKALDDFYKNSDTEKETAAHFGLGVDLGFLVTRSQAWKALPIGKISGLRSYNMGALAIYGSYAAGHSTDSLEPTNVRVVGAGIEALPRAHAMQSLIWEMGVLGGWELLTLSRPQVSGSSHILKLGLRPALWFEVADTFKLGLGCLWTYRTPLAVDRAIERENLANLMTGSGIEPAFRLEVTF